MYIYECLQTNQDLITAPSSSSGPRSLGGGSRKGGGRGGFFKRWQSLDSYDPMGLSTGSEEVNQNDDKPVSTCIYINNSMHIYIYDFLYI